MIPLNLRSMPNPVGLMESAIQFKRKKAILVSNDRSEYTETEVFEKYTKAEAPGRIVSHLAYHNGQQAFVILIRKVKPRSVCE